jgi:hypothetical protein
VGVADAELAAAAQAAFAWPKLPPGVVEHSLASSSANEILTGADVGPGMKRLSVKLASPEALTVGKASAGTAAASAGSAPRRQFV